MLIKHYLRNMKNLTTIFAILIFGMFVASPVLAHVDTFQDSEMETFMRQMMGSGSFERMEELEEEMMGEENHERMEELMGRMFSGNLSVQDQQELIGFMNDGMTGQGAQNMMMRMMMPRAMHGYLGFDSSGSGLMHGTSSIRIGSWVTWVTMILVWALLVLGIVALWRYLNK
jgi:hypothetical protein